MADFAALRAHREATKSTRITELFDADPGRFGSFSASACGLTLDYSKTAIDAEGLNLLLGLAASTGVMARAEAMFAGEKINETEDRAVLHTALRNLSGGPVTIDGADVMPQVRETLSRMAGFSHGLRDGSIATPGGERFADVVNIGIGGSDLGPVMATLALAPYHDGPRTHFVSNVDGAHIHDVLKGLDPARTLVIVASKTFTTIETMTNAETARKWIAEGVRAEAAGGHFAALSSAVDKTAAFGIDPARVFGFEDWVGGRYSMWGPIGLSLMIAIGPEAFMEFLGGAEAMDTHFREAPPAQNLPLLMGSGCCGCRRICSSWIWRATASAWRWMGRRWPKPRALWFGGSPGPTGSMRSIS